MVQYLVVKEQKPKLYSAPMITRVVFKVLMAVETPAL